MAPCFHAHSRFPSGFLTIRLFAQRLSDSVLHLIDSDDAGVADLFVFKVLQAFRYQNTGLRCDSLDVLKAVLLFLEADRIRDILRELERGCRARQQRRGTVACVGDVVFVDAVADSRVGIHQVIELVIHVADGSRHAVHGGETAVELIQFVQDARVNGILAVLLERFHEPFDLFAVAAGQMIEQTLEVAGDQDVHGGRAGQVEISVQVVGTGRDEVRKDVVLIARADVLLDRDAHLARVVRREDVAEVAGRDDDVDLVALFDDLALDELQVAVYIVRDLRDETADVDGVRGGKLVALFAEVVVERFIVEDLLHACLRIVEVALDREDMRVLAGLSDHLAFLHLADAVFRIEDDDLGAGQIRKSFECRLAGVTGGRGQDADALIFLFFLHRRLQEVRHDGQRHILERCGLAMVQLHEVGVFRLDDRDDLLGVELLIVCAVHAALEFFIGKVFKEGLQDRERDILVRTADHFLDLKRKLRDLVGDVQPAVFGNALDDGLRRCLDVSASSRALIMDHFLSSFFTIFTLQESLPIFIQFILSPARNRFKTRESISEAGVKNGNGYHDQTLVYPPSTGIAAPVMNLASSLTRKVMIAATSKSSPIRCMGCSLRYISF